MNSRLKDMRMGGPPGMGLFVQESVPDPDRGHPVVELRELWTGVPCQAISPLVTRAGSGNSGMPASSRLLRRPARTPSS